ncbi:MAG: heparan N-sulfatase, partial [Planctomycetes bacterium]|nr:heparan N-sulfatase [Planctomycetota bacterium]
SPTKTVCLKSRTQPGQEFFWAMNFGKRPAEELYQIDTDAECLRNLAGDPHYASIKAKLEAQMMEELTAQKDPRALGKGDVFESYPYANARSRNYYERITNGKCKAGGWINASDVEPLPSNKTRKKPAKKK